jgi:DNA replication and repair protein RecF
LKLNELAYIEEKTGEKPVLLLDDILSELDHEHRRIIFDLLDHQQTIITTTDKHLLPKLSHEANMIELSYG